MKKISYGKQTILDEDIKAVVEVLKSDFLTQGPKVSEFEETLAKYHGAKYGVAFCNGTAALHGTYNAIGIKPGDEIITTPITFVATANGAIYCGGKPVLTDINPNTNCIDVSKIEEKITQNTKAISPVSLAGYPVDLKTIRKIADNHGLYIIHDSAHALGSSRNGTFGMEYADMAILSFHPVKHIATGEGGMVLTNNEELYKKLLLFRSHGITKDSKLLNKNDGPWYYEMQSLGYNYRMSDIHAALGISQFKRVNDNLISRNKTAKIYNDAFENLDFLIIPPNIGFNILKTKDATKTDNIHAYHLYTLRLKNPAKRLEFYTYLHEKGIMAQIHYVPVHMQPYYMVNFGYKQGDFPNAENYYASEISIPMYHNITVEDRQYVIDTITAFNSVK